MMAIGQMVYAQFLGLSLLMWSGIFTLLLLVLTAAAPALNQRGIHAIPLGYHRPLAAVTIVFALLHGLAALAARFGL